MATATKMPKKLSKLEKLELKVTDALKDLGTTYQSVRETLAAKKIKGEPESADTCPIALYLQKKFPKVVGIVVGDEIEMEFDEGWVCVKTPKPIQTFIGKFDSEKFPELIHPDYKNDE